MKNIFMSCLVVALLNSCFFDEKDDGPKSCVFKSMCRDYVDTSLDYQEKVCASQGGDWQSGDCDPKNETQWCHFTTGSDGGYSRTYYYYETASCIGQWYPVGEEPVRD